MWVGVGVCTACSCVGVYACTVCLCSTKTVVREKPLPTNVSAEGTRNIPESSSTGYWNFHGLFHCTVHIRYNAR